MIFIEGIALGLSTGVMCLATCGPVLIPFLLSEGNPPQKKCSLCFGVPLRATAGLSAHRAVGRSVGAPFRDLQTVDLRNYEHLPGLSPDTLWILPV